MADNLTMDVGVHGLSRGARPTARRRGSAPRGEDMGYTVRLIESVEDRTNIFRLRYSVYVTEMGRTQHHADHVHQLIAEPLDETAGLIGAFDGDEIVGTARFNRASQPGMEFYRDFLGLG